MTDAPEVEIQDAYPFVHTAITKGIVANLKSAWRAHPKLKIEIDPRPIRIEKHVLWMLHEQAQIGGKAGEIPLYFLHMKDSKTDLGLIKAMWVGPVGEHGHVTFSLEDQHFIQALNAVLSLGGVMPLGHTHPSGYGPIFSEISASILNANADPGISADYHVARHFESLGSNLHLMTAVSPKNPSLTMLGVIRIKPDHTIVFHPWQAVHGSHHVKLTKL